MQRKPDLGDRCKIRLSPRLSLQLGPRCNGNLTWAIVASMGRPVDRRSCRSVQRKPDLGDRCKSTGRGRLGIDHRVVQRKPDLGDRCKFKFFRCDMGATVVQRKPDLGDRCKIPIGVQLGKQAAVQRKPDLGDRCKTGSSSPLTDRPRGATET